jgi:hypothetical protein
MSSNTMKNYGIATNAIDEEQVGSYMAFSQANPVPAALVETVFPKCLRQRVAGNQYVENVLDSLGFKLRMLSRGEIVRA